MDDYPSKLTLPYRAYSRANDRVITNEQIDHAVREYPDARFAQPDFESFHAAAVNDWDSEARQMAQTILTSHPGDIAVTLLLDHSGSLRGEVACLLACMAGAISSCLAQASIRHEILGFTTRSWHGGISRAAWLKSGEAFPGRLCDILHIVHRRFEDASELSFDAMLRMTFPALCKENIDGEALEWAVERLRAAHAQRRILIVLSDGAPVDDATLLANYPDILTSHLEKVTEEIVRAGDVELYAISTNSEHWLPNYYPQYAVAPEIEAIADVVLPTVAAVVCHPASVPSAEQLSQRGADWTTSDMTHVFDIP